MTLPPVMGLLEPQAETTRGGWQLRRGALLGAEGVTFSVWAPRAREMVVHVEGGAAAGDHPLTRADGERGVWSALVPGVAAGACRPSVSGDATNSFCVFWPRRAAFIVAAKIVAGKRPPDTAPPCTLVIGVSPSTWPTQTAVASCGTYPTNQALP